MTFETLQGLPPTVGGLNRAARFNCSCRALAGLVLLLIAVADPAACSPLIFQYSVSSPGTITLIGGPTVDLAGDSGLLDPTTGDVGQTLPIFDINFHPTCSPSSQDCGINHFTYVDPTITITVSDGVHSYAYTDNLTDKMGLSSISSGAGFGFADGDPEAMIDFGNGYSVAISPQASGLYGAGSATDAQKALFQFFQPNGSVGFSSAQLSDFVPPVSSPEPSSITLAAIGVVAVLTCGELSATGRGARGMPAKQPPPARVSLR